MTIRNLFASAVLTLIFGQPALASDAQTLAKQYVNMPEVRQMADEMLSPSSLAAQFEAGLSSSIALTDEQRDQIGTILSDALIVIRPQMDDLMVASSSKHFTADELQALIDFYSSEHGASVMSKMQPYLQDVMVQLTPEIQRMMKAVTPDIIKIIQGN